jgi:hypothetical protein
MLVVAVDFQVLVARPVRQELVVDRQLLGVILDCYGIRRMVNHSLAS